MKILIVSHEYPPIGGGGANACLYLSREYAKRGNEVKIITVWYEDMPEAEIITQYGASIKITRLKAKRKKKEHCSFVEMLDFLIMAMKEADREVRSAIKQGMPYEICHVFFGIPSGPVGYRLKKKYGLPYVIRFGGGDIPGFQDRFTVAYKLLSPAIRLIWKNADALVANSEGLKCMALDYCDSYPFLVFPNGVDTEEYYPPSKKSYDHNTMTLLFVSRLLERKGLQYLIPHLGELEEKSGKKLKLVIVGDGPYRETLERLADEYCVKDRVTFEGQKDKEELLPYYQSADIFVLPSKKEGMPNVVLEAMACGLPIVMSPCQGSRELIDNNGIVSSKDISRFHDSILMIITKSALDLMGMSEQSRYIACTRFSWKSVANNYIDLFDIVLKKGSSIMCNCD